MLHDWVSVSLALTRRAVAALSDAGPDVPAPPSTPRRSSARRSCCCGRPRGRSPARPEPRVATRCTTTCCRSPVPSRCPLRLCLDPARALESAFAHIQLSALGNGDAELDLLLDAGPRGAGLRAGAVRHRRAPPGSGCATSRPAIRTCRGLATLLAAVEPRPTGRRAAMHDAGRVRPHPRHHARHGPRARGRSPCPRPVDELLADLDALLGRGPRRRQPGPHRRAAVELADAAAATDAGLAVRLRGAHPRP